MKKKISPFHITGFLLLLIGSVINIVFRFVDVDWDYSLLSICIYGLSIILLAIGIFKSSKTSK